MRDDRKREHREIGWGVGKQARKQVEEGTNRGEREMPIKGEKRKASRDKKKRNVENGRKNQSNRLCTENCLNETRTGRNLAWSQSKEIDFFFLILHSFFAHQPTLIHDTESRKKNWTVFREERSVREINRITFRKTSFIDKRYFKLWKKKTIV